MTATSPLRLDPHDPVHAVVLARLAADHIGWLTTVRADGSPHAVPVWFLWHDGRLLVMSEPRTVKVTNVRRGSPALLHLHTNDHDGNGVVVLSGPAVVSDRTATQWLPEIGEAYTAKYAEAMVAYGMGLGPIAEKFHVVIELEPTALQAW
jgi:PPOX class probable F420-dependent enzyme